MTRPSGRFAVLCIGPSQNGKSTFVNRLIKCAVNKEQVKTAKEGDGNFKQTTKCDFYDIDVPLTDYLMIDFSTGREYDVPDIAEEERVLNSSWWRKQTRSKYVVEARDRSAPLLQLRLIDTPGLDDSEGKDFENMRDVLSILNSLAQSKVPWETKIGAIVLVYNANSAFSHSFQIIIKDYQKCMPNLFGNLAVINTHFSITALSQKRQHLIREKILGESDNSRSRIIKDRAREFAKILGDKTVPTQFFIDNKPKSTLAYDELISCNTIYDILTFWSGCRPMLISQMRLIKNQKMQAIDKQLQSYLNDAITRWTAEKEKLLKHASMSEAYRSTLQQQREQLKDEISRIQSDLDRYDNESEFPIRTHAIAEDPHVLALFGRYIIRKGITGTKTISEPDYDEFSVDAQNVATARWTSKSFNYTTKSWTGTYYADPGKAPKLLARSFTTNRAKYSDTISKLRSQLRRCQADEAENDSRWERDFGCDDEINGKGRNPELEALVSRITACKNLMELLNETSPPLDRSFDAASERRYGKSLRDVDQRDLYDLVRVSNPDLLMPLMGVLG